MKKITSSIVALLVGLLLAASIPATNAEEVPNKHVSISLPEIDTAHTAILLAENPTTSAQYAALELQYHFRLWRGVTLPILREPQDSTDKQLISVGHTNLFLETIGNSPALKDWEFLVTARDRHVFLAGGDAQDFGAANWNTSIGKDLGDYSAKPIGTIYAVYEYLTQIGFRWYLPGEENLSLPESKSTKVELEAPIRRKTDFLSTSLWPNDLNKNMFWSPGDPPLETSDLMSRTEVIRWKTRNKVGGPLYQPNHSFNDWLPAYGIEHPEWFTYKSRTFIRELLKKPDWKYKFNHFGNVCLYQPGVLDQVVENAKLFFEHGRQSTAPHQGSFGDFFAVVLNDTTFVCTAAPDAEYLNKPTLIPGKNGSTSFYLWNFINEVAKQTEHTHPGKYIAGLAYQNYTLPPANLQLRPNVAVTVCSLQGNTTPGSRDTTYELINAWKKIGAGWVGLWEYYNMQRSGWSGVPRIAPVLVANDTKKVYDLGVRSEFMELDTWDADARDVAKGLPSGVAWISPIRTYLNSYVRFRMWDDLRNNPEDILNEHYERFYGPAAHPIKQFFELIESRVTDMSLRGEGKITDETVLTPEFDWVHLAPPEIFDRLDALMQEAVKLADGEPFKTRVGWVKGGIMDNMSASRKKFLDSKKSKDDSPVAPLVTKPPIVISSLGFAPTSQTSPDADPWKQVPWIELTGKDSTSMGTKMKAGFFGAEAFFLVETKEESPEKIKAQGIRDLQVFLDDGIEVFIGTNPVVRHQYAHFILNSKGVLYDARGDAGNEDISWNASQSEFHVAPTSEGFRYFFRLNVADLATEPPSGSSMWYGNIIRNRFFDSDGSKPTKVDSYFPAQGPYWLSMGEMKFSK